MNEYTWVGEDRGHGNPEDILVIEAKKAGKLEVLNDEYGYGGYDFTQRAIVRVGRTWFLITASGCSCTSAEEEWTVNMSGTLRQIRKAVLDGDYQGYTLMADDRKQMVADIDARLRKVN